MVFLFIFFRENFRKIITLVDEFVEIEIVLGKEFNGAALTEESLIKERVWSREDVEIENSRKPSEIKMSNDIR